MTSKSETCIIKFCFGGFRLTVMERLKNTGTVSYNTIVTLSFRQ